MDALTHDGRRVAFEQWGPPSGVPLFSLAGTPGGRLSRHPDPEMWRSLGVRLVTFDRPGYGRSPALPGRTVAQAADDVAAIADHLGLEQFFVMGVSGGGPHALACAARLPRRVLGCAVLCTAAPLDAAEEAGLVHHNRTSFERLRSQGREGLADFLEPVRQAVLDDPLRGLLGQLADAPAVDLDWYRRTEVQHVHSESMLDALRAGVDGWVDDGMAIYGLDWGFTPEDVEVPVQFWHSDNDANSPLSAVRRLACRVPSSELSVWRGEGHSASARLLPDVLKRLVGSNP